MEKSFRAQSWLGIIKGSNYHIDFSSPENFDESLDELVRQITHVEKKLSMQPRKYFCTNFYDASPFVLGIIKAEHLHQVQWSIQ